MKRLIALISLAVLAAVALVACGQTQSAVAPTVEAEAIDPDISLTTAPESEVERALYRAEPYFIGARFPLALEWGPDGQLYYAEKNGAIRVIDADGNLREDPVYTFEVDYSGERGLLGFTHDPNFLENGYIWAFYTWPTELKNVIARITVVDGVGQDEQVAWEFPIEFETSTILNGGGIRFGPDGMLYIGAGSTNNVYAASERNSPNGKIHRFAPTVPLTPAEGNPEAGNSIYVWGLRNPFDIDFHPVTGILYISENGGDCDDEINVAHPGEDMGWNVEHTGCFDHNLPPDWPFTPPLLYYTPPISPTGISFYTGDMFPEYANDMLFCSWHGARMIRIKLGEGEEGQRHIVTTDLLETAPFACRLDVETGPDGAIYYSDISAIYRLVRNE